MSSNGPTSTFELPPQVVRDLPAMPAVAGRIFRMVDNPDTDATDIAQAISMDPTLTAKVLKSANSSYYSPTTPITNLSQAVARMGLRALRNVVVIECLPLKGKSGEAANPLASGLWEHAVATAIGARIVAGRVVGCSPDDAFVAGLLHDIGKSALLLFKQTEYPEVIRQVQEGGGSFAEIEKARWGFDHADVGAAVLRLWQLPDVFVEGVRFHHRLAEIRNPSLWAQVEIAGRNAKAALLGIEKRRGLRVADGEGARLVKWTDEFSAALKVSFDAAWASEKSLFQV